MPKSIEEEYFQQAHEQYHQLINTLSEEQSQSWEHGEVESYINQEGTELLRRLLQGHLDLRYAEEEYQTKVEGADGEKRPHRRKKTQRKLETLFGEVIVTRVGYSTQQPEVSALYPADGQLNLPPDKYSDGLRRRVAVEASKVSFAETSQRDPQQQREWVVLVDGEEHQLKTIKAIALKQEVEVNIVLDFIHVLEYVWKAAFCFCSSGSEAAETWVQERALRILKGKASDVAAGIRRSATLQKLSPTARENADKCADYLLKYRQYLQYNEYLEKGYPIATGVIEGACRHLVNDRMEITGARWRLDRAEAVLRIRALRSSGDFDQYWEFHKMQEFKRNHVSKFQEPERLLAI